MSMTRDQKRARAQRAAHARWHGESTEAVEAKAALEEANEEARRSRRIDELIASWPKMTAAQRDRISGLVAPLAKAAQGDSG